MLYLEKSYGVPNFKKKIQRLLEFCVNGDQVLGQERNLRQAWHQDVVERFEYEKDQFTAGKTLEL